MNPVNLFPNAGENQIWIVHATPGVEPHYRMFLSSEERARAERFVRSEDCRRFVVIRGALRCLLGQALQCDPRALAFKTDKSGKPQLDSPDQLEFSVSHSGGLGLIAIGPRPLGVDIELVRYEIDCDGIAARVFSQPDVSALGAISIRARRVREFFRLWTRLEAYSKALGGGLQDIEKVPAASGAADSEAGVWLPFSVESAGEYVGAIVVDPQRQYRHS